MSTLLAIAYPDAETAEKVRGELIQATKEKLVELQDAVVVEHSADGKIKLHQAVSTTGAGAAGGAMWGGLIGLLFLAPLFGMAIGAASGALAGKVSDAGVNDDFMKQLGAKLEPGRRRPDRAGEQRRPGEAAGAAPPLWRRRHPDLAGHRGGRAAALVARRARRRVTPPRPGADTASRIRAPRERLGVMVRPWRSASPSGRTA